MIKSIWKDFRYQYEISRTLRFSLVQFGDRKKEEKIIKNWHLFLDEGWENILDIAIQKKEKKWVILKEINTIFIEFINKSLERENVQGLSEKLNKLYSELEKYYKNKVKEDRKRVLILKKELAKGVETIFETSLIEIEWVNKKISKKDILSSDIFTVLLKSKFKDKTDFLDVIDIYKWDTSYFRLDENKKGIFDWTLKKNQFATRIIDNFDKFVINKINFSNIIKILSDNSIEIDDSIIDDFKDLSHIFEVWYYLNCLNQKGIDYYNNQIWVLNSSELLNNIIQKIQNHNKKNKDNKIYLPKKLLTLDKQLLSLKDQNNIEIIKTNQDFVEKFNKFYNDNIKYIKDIENHFKNFYKCLYYSDDISNKDEFDFSKIYLRNSEISQISWTIFKDYNFLINLLEIWNSSKKEINLYKLLKILDDEKIKNLEKSEIFKKYYLEKLDIENKNNKKIFIEIWNNIFIEKLNLFNLAKNKINLTKIKDEFSKNIDKDWELIWDIYEFSNSVRNIYSFVSWFYLLEEKREWKKRVYEKKEIAIDDICSKFYDPIDNFFDNSEIVESFNQFRNFLSKKPYNKDKLILDFDLTGWKKKPDWSMNFNWFFLRDKSKIILWIILKNNVWILNEFKNKWIYDESLTEWQYYYFMEYLTSDWSKVILKQFSVQYAKKYEEKYGEGKRSIGELVKLDLSEKQELEIAQDLIKLVEKYAYNNFPEIRFIVDNKDDYKTIKQVQDDFEKTLTYNIIWRKIRKDYIDSLENILLFELNSKDLKNLENLEVSKSMDLNTMYLIWLFDKKNIDILNQKDNWSVFELDWWAQIFFREKSINDVRELRTKKKLDYYWKKPVAVIKNERYTKNTLLFHVPIRINYRKKVPLFTDFNKNINNVIYSNFNEIKYLWIDRWEKNLIYISLINKDWVIIERKTLSLNWEKTENYPDWVYKWRLRERQAEMIKSRKTWKKIWSIKELKEGYISWAVKEIVDLAVKENAVIILEKLFSWFKNNRKKIDRQIYDKFERALLKKLNYYFEKSDEDWYRNWLQLTPYYYDKNLSETFIDNSKQLWILFYIPASYTSQTCPNCGFIKNNYFIKDRSFFEKYVNEFVNDKNAYSLLFKDWTKLSTNVDRLRKQRKNDEKMWKTYEYDLNWEIKTFFSEEKIDESLDLKTQILGLNKTKFEKFQSIINIIHQLRNSNTEREYLETWLEEDFIYCPRCLYDSRKPNTITYWKTRNIDNIKDADANWAYNIARKWIIMLEKIKNNEKNIWPDLEEFEKGIREPI